MAQKYYSTREAAQILGVGEEQIKDMQERHELRGYRDGTTWKFKVEEVDRLARERPAAPPAAPPEEGDVLLSEVELGESEVGKSGTVIGMGKAAKSAADSDIQLAEDGVKLGETPGPAPKDKKADSKLSQFEELDLTLEEDLSLDDSQLAPGQKPTKGGSTVDLTGKDLEDDDLVLGGSGTGSDITIGGDSGISLVDPADSGLSLEAPLELGGTAGESLELGEDDMINLADDSRARAVAAVKPDDDFLLTPLEDAADSEDSESGSHVIALDTEGEGSEAATMIGATGSIGPMAAMLEEDLGGGAGGGFAMGAPMGMAAMGAAPLGAQPGGLAAGAPAVQSAAILPETPYSIWNVLSLVLCAILLILCGMMMYDLLRNMWSWDSPYQVNSSIMDWILKQIEKP